MKKNVKQGNHVDIDLINHRLIIDDVSLCVLAINLGWEDSWSCHGGTIVTKLGNSSQHFEQTLV